MRAAALLVPAAVLAFSEITLAADDDIYHFLQADRFEYATSDQHLVWDAQGWLGDDYHKLWVKSEGDYEDASIGEGEVQLLYSRAWTAFFDWQFGLRHDFEPSPTRNHLVIGAQGLAPQWFEIDSALFLSDDGDLSARVEAEYDLLLTQRLVLQPRLEIEIAASSVPELGIGSGVTEAEIGLRLRYEWRRKVAPYIGIEWQRYFGGTADFAESAGFDREEVTFLVGLRLWY